MAALFAVDILVPSSSSDELAQDAAGADSEAGSRCASELIGMGFSVGCWVTLHRLKAMPELNGQIGEEASAGGRKRHGESQMDSKVTSIWTHLEEAPLLKLIREHDMATSESCESGESRPAPSA